MAAIEKICEFSGDYPGWDMYKYKRNHIQIMPEHRKLFAKCKCILVIHDKEMVHINKKGGLMFSCDTEFLSMLGYKLKPRYTYSLVVLDENLQSEVEGIYLNWSTKIGTVIRKMKRLTKNPHLKVIRDFENFNDNDYREKLKQLSTDLLR